MADDIEQILSEIRDIQREHLAEFRRASERTSMVQQRVMKMQRRAVFIGVIALVTVAAGIAMMLVGAHMGH